MLGLLKSFILGMLNLTYLLAIHVEMLSGWLDM